MNIHTHRCVIVRLLALGLACSTTSAGFAANVGRDPGQAPAPLQRRTEASKPASAHLGPHDCPNVVYVKFRDDASVRLRNGHLDDLGTGQLVEAAPLLQLFADAASGGRWERLHQIDEAKLDDLRQRAQANLGRATADLNSEFLLWLPALSDAAATIDVLNTLEIVEIAWPLPLPVPPPLPPSYLQMQGYLDSSPGGIDAKHAWSSLGNRGAGIRFADCEYLFNPNHQDLPPVTILGPQPQDPGFGPNHGTAVLGQVAGMNNGWGVTGICSEATFYFAGTYTSGVVNIAAAITNCLAVFEPGDVIILEAQTAGPLYFGGGSQYGLVPVDWVLATYNAVVTAVGNGVVVLEAAGNGEQNLDDPLYSTGNGGHWPFLPQNDSGAIIVGAGASPFGSNVDRSRLWYSNYGSTVDLQGWGEWVTTTGYGGLYSAEGQNLWYTSSFGGTSSATPIVGGACALIQSIQKDKHGSVLPPAVVRQALIDTGSPQQSGQYPASQHIGPRPDLLAALGLLDLLCVGDLDADGSVGGGDMGILLGSWGPCLGCSADLNDDGWVDGADVGLLLGTWGSCG